MRVQLFDYSDDALHEAPMGPPCDFGEAFPLGSIDYVERACMFDELERVGRAWTGGGAAPLLLVMRTAE